MKLSKDTFIYSLLIIPISAVLFLYGYIGSFNRLIADSFCSFYYAERLGLPRSVWFWWINWSGRYSAYAFDWLVDSIFGTNITWIIPLVLIFWTATLIALVYYLLKTNSLDQKQTHLSFVLGPSILFLLLTNAPDVQQSFLWLDGLRAYSLPLFLLTVYAVLFFVITEKLKSKTSMPILMATLFLCFASGGLSETFAVFQFMLIAYWIVCILVIHKTPHSLSIPVSALIGSILSLTIIIAAPGNKIRQSVSPPTLGILEILKISAEGYADFLKGIFFTPEKITVFLGVMLIFIWAGSIYTGSIDRPRLRILLGIPGAGILSFICFPPGVYGYGTPPPERTMMIPLFILATLLPAAGFIGGYYLQKTAAINVSKLALAPAVLFILVSSAINAHNLYESRTEYIAFSEKWDTTNELILTAKTNRQEPVEIPAMTSWTRLDRPNDNPKHWMTKCYSDFYGIQVLAPPY